MARNRTRRAAALVVGGVVLVGGGIVAAGPASAQVKPIDCVIADGRGVTIYSGNPNSYRAVACYGYTGSAPNALSVRLAHTSAVGSGGNTGYVNYWTSNYEDRQVRMIPHAIAPYIDRDSTTYGVVIWS